MNTLEINLPYFPGFYHSALDLSEYFEVSEDENCRDFSPEEFEKIDWHKTNNNVGMWYLENFVEETEQVLKYFGINLNFVKIDSPKYYNYSTDKLVCKVTFDKSKVIQKLFKRIESDESNYWGQFIKDKFTSYSGFCSSYSNDPEIWESELLDTMDTDNVVFETVLEFIMGDVFEENFIYNLYEDAYSMVEFNN